MRIKKLELVGFKSFRDRTVIHFDQGITGIVGPNGCGKSNIVDSLIWVMGETSAKHLRGSTMSDVIFAGSDLHAPSGMAEVSLTLENEGGLFPSKYLDHSEIMITRRLHRSGESEYLINKEQCRLRDIQEIFMDTGAGAKGFSIIEQGRIGEIITKKPIDRKFLIEEVAGITKFRMRKRESQRKLASTEQNLLRLQDVLSEQKRQILSLERQAQRAERYRKIKNELQEKDIWLASKKYTEYTKEIREQKDLFNSSQKVEFSSDNLILELEVELQNLRVKLAESGSQVESSQLAHQKNQQITADKQNAVKDLGFEIEQARRDKKIVGSVTDQHETRKQGLKTEKQEIIKKMDQSQQVGDKLDIEIKDLEERYKSIIELVRSQDAEINLKRSQMIEFSQEESQAHAQQISLVTQFEEKTKSLEEERTYLLETEFRYKKILKNQKSTSEKLEVKKQLQLKLMSDVEVFEQNLQCLSEKKEATEIEVNNTKTKFNEVSSRLYGLENLQTNYEGFEEGVKSIMLWQSEKSQSNFQPLAEVIEVKAEYEVAMEAALGEKLQVLLGEGESSKDAVEAVDYLKKNNSGRSSFSTVYSSIKEKKDIKSEVSVKALLSDVVSCPDKYKKQLLCFLDSVAIVDSIQSALNLQNQYPEYSFVTLEGETLSSQGVLSGGSLEHIESGFLKRRREIKELSLKKNELSQELSLKEGQFKKLVTQYKQITDETEQAKKEAGHKEIQVIELKKDFERANDEDLEQQLILEKTHQEISHLEVSLDQLQTQSNRFEELRSQNTQQKDGLSDRVFQLNNELIASRVQTEEFQTEITKIQVKNASVRQEISGDRHQLDMICRSLASLEIQIHEMSQTSAKNTQVMTQGQVQLEEAQSNLDRLIRETQISAESVSQFKDTCEEVQAEVQGKQEKLNSLSAEKNQCQARINESQLKLEQLRMKEQYITDQIRERYMKEISELAPEFADKEGNIKETEEQVKSLRTKLNQLGEVNLSAVEEYDEFIEHYEFLKAQCEDLVTAKDQLQKVIDRINRICSKKFKETFDQINKRFTKVFPALFGGGQAELTLVEYPEKEEVGIDIIACPPGKKMQNINLLSGGEKALTAASLIFAIFLVKPSPFCLLDEVDAPLDDVNVFRFNELIKEMAKRSQIIVVTHNKYTMKINNKLFGVTMQEKGLSKMVSVSLDEERTSDFSPQAHL